MGFLDRLLPPPPIPVEPEPEPADAPWMKPEASLPRVVATELVLAHTPDAAVAIAGLLAYPSGFLFTVTAMLREAENRSVYHGYFPRRAGVPVPDRFLVVGVHFSDGRATSNLHHLRPSTVEPDGPVMLGDRGIGGALRHDETYWVWPLPPPGPVTFACTWPAHGISESHAEIDAGLILDAASRAVELWPA